MKVAKARFVNPDHNFWFGFTAIALSVFVFAYSRRFGQVSILAYYAVWLPLILIDYRRSLGDYTKSSWIVAFGVLACFSVFWSAAPGVTARASVQYMSHIMCALIAARTVNVRTLTLGSLAGIGIVLVYSLVFGRVHVDPLDGSYSFVGAFASKNQLGFFASLGVYFAFACVMVLHERRRWKVFALAIGLLSGYALVASQSATSIAATGAVLAGSVCLAATLLFSPRVRKAFLLLGLASALGAAFVALNMGALEAVLGAFGKDATLTGRTYLWSQGLAAAGEAPVIGVGYYAYWVQGFSEAERLWEEFYIEARGGFHFHNTYIEVLVELGLTGLVLISLLMAGILVGHLKRLLNDGRNPQSLLMLGVGGMLLIRSFFEVDFINPYAIGSFLLYYSAGLLAQKRRSAVPATDCPPRAATNADRLAIETLGAR
jgi:exopolysaccharide production protein ExoQ